MTTTTTTNKMGFDTIEINLVTELKRDQLFVLICFYMKVNKSNIYKDCLLSQPIPRESLFVLISKREPLFFLFDRTKENNFLFIYF